jgi:transcriptional regulator with XRE-family HTH domain
MEDPKELSRRIGRQLAQLRRKAGKTQEELAEELGIGWRYLSRAERGTENFTIETLAKFANAFHVKVAALLTRPAASAVKVTRGRPRTKR